MTVDAEKLKAKVSRVRKMKFSQVYPLYVQKAERKARTRAEVDQIITWLTGYSDPGSSLGADLDFETFFSQAPAYNPSAEKITGVICGERIETIEDEVLRKVRILDKLIDDLAKGKSLEKILGIQKT